MKFTEYRKSICDEIKKGEYEISAADVGYYITMYSQDKELIKDCLDDLKSKNRIKDPIYNLKRPLLDNYL